VGISLKTFAVNCLWPAFLSLAAILVQAHAGNRKLSLNVLVGLDLAVAAVGTLALFLLQVTSLALSDLNRGWITVVIMLAVLWSFAESIRRNNLLQRRQLRQQDRLDRRVIGVWLCNVFGFLYLAITAITVNGH
jgi:hypothetical protein